MRKRKVSTRAGAWVLSAAMLINGMPLNVFAESAEDGIYTESVEDTGDTDAIDSGDGVSSVQENWESEDTGEDNSAAEQGADNGTSDNTGENTEIVGEAVSGNSEGANTEAAAGNDTSGSIDNSTADDFTGDNAGSSDSANTDVSDSGDNSDFVDSEGNNQEEIEDSNEDTSDDITTHDAIFQILWSDENNLADRRDDQDLSRRFIIYQNGQPMESQPQILLDKEMEDGAGGTRLGTYRVQSLPDSDGSGTDYTYSIKENVPVGYEAFTADAVTGLDDETTASLLAQLIAPDQELPVTLAEGDGLYRADKMFGNYLRQYTFEGKITWNDNANQQNIRPDLESWFQNHIQITLDGAAYKSFRVHYEQNADDESVWNYQIKGLFAVKEDKTQATYEISLNAPEGYATENGTFAVNGNQQDCQTTFGLVQNGEDNTDEPETEPTEAPEENAETESTEDAEAEEFSALDPEDALIILDAEGENQNSGTAELVAAFLDKSAEGKDYPQLLSRYGVYLNYQIGSGTAVPIKLVYAENAWKVDPDDSASAKALAAVGLTSADLATKITSSWTLGTGSLSLAELPSATKTGESITWSLGLAEDNTKNRPGYCAPVKSEDSNTYKFVPYYKNAAGNDFSITIDLREGGKQLQDTDIEKLLRKLTLSYTNIDGVSNGTISLADLLNKKGNSLFENAYIDESCYTYDAESNKITLTIPNLPWCTTDKNEFVYSITSDEIGYEENGISTIPSGDKLVPRYDNAGSSNYGSITDRCHDNGILYLTLTGDTEYSATKIWLDENPGGQSDGRPTPTWKLWRYPKKDGVDFTKASPVLNESGEQIKWNVDNTVAANKEVSYGVVGTAQSGITAANNYDKTSLPKYDSDGYEYIYFIRENNSGGTESYEQIYGKISTDTNGNIVVDENGKEQVGATGYLPGDERAKGDSSVYNGNTLSNRITGSTSTSVRKVWKNAAHQDNIQDVTVTLTLQSTTDPKAARLTDGKYDSSISWTNVKDVQMNGFKSEIQELQTSESVPKYDALGRKLYYRWIESNVTEKKDTAEDIVKGEDGAVKQFTLACNRTDENTRDGKEWYSSESSINEETGETVITNSLTGETKYFVDKIWEGWEGLPDNKTAPADYANKTIKVILFQGNHPLRDEAGKVKEFEISANTSTEDRNWSLLIDQLPKYSAEGYKLTYYAVEQNANDGTFSASFEYNLEELNKYSVNNAQITNSPGNGTKFIRLEKEWKDDGDTYYRYPVQVGVWRTRDNKYLGKEILSEANNWWSYFSIKAEDYQDGDTYYIREIGMGVKEDGNVIYPTYTTSTNTVSNGKTPEKQENTLSDLAVTGTGDNLTAAGGATPLNVVTDYVDTGDSEYRYDVTYSVIKGTGNKNTNNTAGEGKTEGSTTNGEESVFPMDTYRVTNHRYGWINLKVTKKWVDGSRSSSERLALGAKLKVEIANPASDKIGAEITENGVVANGITYPIYGNAELTQTAQSLQAIGNTADGENTETVYFYNLPKFDSKGAKIRYKVVEYAPGKDAEGNTASLDVTTAKTTLSDADYGTSVEDGKYVVVDNVRHALDTQEITVTNRRSATKDIYFYKLWIDQVVKDKRPDIFMVLYQSVNGAAPTKYGEFKPYEVSQTADGAYIKYEFQNLPKYDGNGAEITYYALEDMHADGSALDYIPVQYYYSGQADTVAGNKDPGITDLKKKYLTDIGAKCYATIGYENNKYTVTNSPSADVNVLTAQDNAVVLKESGTFVNEIRNTVEIDGKKVWANVLADFPKNNLPAINFVLLQKLKGSSEKGTEVATFNDWLSTDANKTEFSFAMKYVGLNDKTGAYKGVWTKTGTEGSVTVGESVSAENQWTQLLPKYDKNGNLYEYTLREKYKENTDFAGLYTVSGLNTYQVNNTFKVGTRSITIEKNWDDTDKSVAGKRPDVTFELYRFFGIEDENGKETYTSPKKVATQILKNGESTVTFSNLHVYAPDKSICYYYVKEVVPNGYENPAGVKNPTGIEMNYTGTGIVEATNVTIDGKDDTTTSSIFRFTDDATASQSTEGSTSNSAAVTFTNKYKDTQTETTTIKGQKIWDDQSNAFGTRPDSIKITLKRYTVNNSAGNNNAYGAENVFGTADEKIVLKLPTAENQNEIVSKYVKTASSGSPTNEIVKSEMVNTSADGITVTVKKNADTNIWDYEISGLDKYAPNSGEWIYTIEEETVAITDSNGTEIGHYTSYVGTSESNTISSAQGTKGEGNTVIMPSLTNKLNTTSANVTKIWQNQQLVISRLMEIKVELWVKIGAGNTATYQKASEVSGFKSRTAADGTPYNVVLEGNSNPNKNSNTWNYTFSDLPTAIKDADGNYQKCSYMVVESAIRYSNETWLELNPSYSNEEISYNASNNKYTITYNHTDATASAVAQTNITNSLTDTKSISFEKQWAGDSGNKYNTRPSTIRIFLQRKISGEADSDYVTIAKWNMSLDSARDKLSNASGSSANGTWSVVGGKATISDLPRYTLTSGTAQEYAYRVIEVGDDTGELTVGGQDESSNDIVASAKNPASNKKAGAYYEVTSTTDENGHTTITNTLPTTSLRVEKTWLNDAGISDTVLKSVYENLKLTLKRYKLDEDGSGQKSDNEIVAGEENVSPVWKKDTTTGNWYAEYTNLPKYYGAYKDSKGTVHGLKYVYYVTEATQPGYLNPEITDPNSSNSYSKAELTNKAIVFNLDKTDGTTSIRNRALTLLLTGIEETGTAGYTAKWSRDAAGKESVVVKNGDTEIYSKTAADSTSHVDIKGLPLGEYTLTETRVPDGYEQLDSAKITLSSVNTSDLNTEQKLSITVADNKQVQVVTTDTNGTALTVPMLTVANTKTSLNVIKTDGSKNLSGAEFVLKPAAGSNFASHDTDKETNGLTFTVNENGIVNNPTTGELIIGNTYILTETKAPDGYIRPDTSTGDKPTVTFTLDANGNIILSGETNGYTITGFASSDVSITANNSESFNIVNHPIEIGLQKISSREDTVKLSGAKFTVTDNTVKATSSEESSYKKEVLTDSNGQLKLTGTDATVKLIQNHSYTLEEIQAPEGYILPDTHPTISFTVDENGTIKNVETSPAGYITISTTGETANKLIEVKNDPIEFSLEKQDIVKNADQSVRYLPDTVFELYKGDKADQNAVYDTVPLKTLKTDANGKLTFATSAGNDGYVLTTGVRYKLVETGAPVGYEKASPFTFVINENGTITYETDSASGNNGAETLYDEAAKTFIVKDTKTSFELDKINSEKKSAINDDDLVLTVKDKAGNTVLTWRRNSEGNVSVEASNSYANTIEYRNGKIHGLPVSVTGTDTEYYILSETGTPKGYATAASVRFTMGVDGKLSYYDNNADVENNNKLELITNETNESKLTIFDQPIRGHVTITKTLDGTNKKLQGVTFNLYKKKGTGTSAAGVISANENILIASGLTTDEKGQWTTENNSTYFAESAGEGSSVPLSKGLPSGTYYFVETSTTDNAVLASGPVGEFTVTDTSATAIVTVDPVNIANAEFKTSLKLKKLDSTTNTAIIKGVTFKLEKYTLENNNVDSTKIDETPVDGNGEIVFDNLQKGKYILTETSATGYDGGFTAYFEIGDKDNGKPIEVNQANANRFFSDAALSTPIASSWLSESGIYNTRKKAALTVYKVGLESPDSVGGIGLNSVEFSLYKKAENAAQASDYAEILKGLKTGNVYKYEAKSTAYTPSSVETNVGTLKITDLEWGDYKLVETKSADGYSITGAEAEFTIDQETDFEHGVKLKVNNNNQILNYQTKLRVKKQGTDGSALAGAQFEIKGVFAGSDGKETTKTATTDSEGNLKLTGAQNTGITGYLIAGKTYTLKETVPPAGYELLKNEVKFKIEENGAISKVNGFSKADDKVGYELTVSGSYDNEITVTNEKNQIQIAKAAKDASTGEYLAGAGFTLTRPDNSTESWISDNEPKVFRGLVPGTYILTETKAPAGYIISDPVTFIVKADGTITDKDDNQIENNLVIMKDTPNTLTIRKTDDLGSELSDEAMGQLELRLKDVTTDETLKDISDAAPATKEQRTATQVLTKVNLTNGVWTLTGVLSGGHTYTLTETSVPDNYLIADPIEFTMGTDGVIQVVSGADLATSDSDKVTNGRINNLYLAGVSTNELRVRDTEVKAMVTITKQDSELKDADKKPLPLEEVQFKFYRQNGLKPDLDEETTDTLIKKNEADETGIWKTGADGKITIENLSEGTYYFREVKADGYIYDPNAVYPVTISRSDDRKQIFVQYGNDKKSEGILENTRNTLTVSKADDHGSMLSPEAMGQVEFTITDITDGEPGNEIVKLTTATSDKYTYDSGKATWTLRGQLVQGHKYKLSETKTPYGYQTADDIAFVMGEDGKVNVPVTDVKTNGSVELTKYQTNADGTAGDALKGVTFDLYRIKGSDIAKLDELKKEPANDVQINDTPLVTDGNGKITVADLPEGSYYFLETSAPADVFMDGATTEIATINASQHGKTVKVEKRDDAFVTYVNVFKADNFNAQEKSGIADTEFTLYKETETKTGKKEFKEIISEANPAKTDENGNVQFTITEAGTYQIRETKAAYGYEYDDDKAYTATFTVTNTKDFQNNVLHLANTVENSSADKEGTLEKYQLKIPKALEDAGDTWKDTVTNKRLNGSVTVTKKDNTNPANVTGINGVTFELYKVNGEEETSLGEFQTGNTYTRNIDGKGEWSSTEAPEDQPGLLKISGLDWGSYYLLETEASGYKLSSEKHTFTIGKKLQGNKISDIDVDLGTITNEQNQIQIAKAPKNAATGKYLAGAGFVLTDPDGFQKQAWFSTEEAKVFSGLPVGVYTLTETKAPVGYKRNTASMSFKVNADGTITDALGNTIANNLVVMEDEPTELVIQKTDEKGETLSEDALKQVELTLTDETLESALEEINTKEPAASSENDVEKKTATITLNMDSANPYVYSANGSWKLTGVLRVGHTYKLAETSVPTNYLIAEPVVFTVGENGAIAIISGTGIENGNNLYFSATENSAQKLQIQDTEIKATVAITKQDSEADKDGNHKKLENVEFKFYRQNSDSPDLSENTKDTLIKNGVEEIWKTNADGKITIENLSEGSYYFREVKADGYIYNPEKVYRVTVGKTETNQKIAVNYGEGFKKDESGTVEPVIENTKNVLTVKKLDGNGEMLSEKSMNELELTLTDITEATEKNPGTTIVKLTTAANDKYTYDPATATWTLKGQLIQGHTYRLSETGRPYGYLIASDITFTMGENGNIQVTSGAVAEREQQSGENTGKNLYTETSLTVTDAQINGSVELTKYLTNADGTAGDVLKGVTFDLYRIKGSDTAKLDKMEKNPENDEKINDEPLVTDGNGKITVSDLPEGSYYFLETSAPANIFMDGATTEIVTIDASHHGKTVTVEKTDDAFVTYVNVFKADNFDSQEKAGIAETEFTLYKKVETEAGTKEFKKVISEQNPAKTDENGNVQFTITEAGTYQIRETNAVYGYKYDADNAYTATFTVTNTNDFQNNVLHLANTAETSSADKENTLEKYQLEIANALADDGDSWKNTVTNERLNGSVTVTKKDNTDPANVTGINKVTFELYKINGKEETKLGEFQTGNIYTRDTEAESGWSAAEAAKDQPGLLKISGLNWGSYYLKETVADVYQVDSTNRYEFVIGNSKNDEEKSGIDVTLDDILNVQNQLTITKIDEDGNPLGSVLDQETLSNLELTVKEVLTDENGKTEEKDVVVLKPAASANGEYGYDPSTTTWTLTGKLTQGHTYKLVETGRPEGYVTAQPITFIMGQDGRIQIQGGSAENADGDKNSAENSEQTTSAEKTAEALNQKGTTNLYTDTALAVRDIKLHADICLEKTDENGAKVQGAVFSLYKLLGKNADPKSDKLIAEGLETGEDGKTPVQTVGEGYYYFVETTAPADKVLDSTPTTPVRVSEEQHGTVVTVPAVNKDFHYSVEITKKDGTDETLLDGVEFTLYEVVAVDANTETDGAAANADNENSKIFANVDVTGDGAADSEPAVTENLVKVASGTTGSENNETGKLTFNITKAGTYEIQETGTIYGYEFDKDNPYKHRFTINNTGEYQNEKLSLEVKNTRSTGTVTLIKKDGETEEALNDIIFALYYKVPGTEDYKKILDTITGKTYTGKIKESETVWEEKAGKTGEITVDSLPWGDYYMVETKADGYVLKDSEYHFTIGKEQSLTSGLNVNLTAKYGEITNDPNQILIAKQDAEGNLIGGAELQLTGPKDYKETWTSVQNGAHLLKRLPEGAYTLTETKAPAGYIRSTEEIRFTVAAGGKILDASGGEIKVTEETPIAITMTNTRNRLTITKVDENGNLLDENAMKTLELTVTDVTAADKLEAAKEERTATQTLTAATQTEDRNWQLEGIFAAGHTYKLEESAAKRPYGYLIADPITFTMGEDGKIQKVYGAELQENAADESTEDTEEAGGQTVSAAGTTNLYTADSLTVRDVAVKGSLQLNKKGPDKKPLENVSFLLYRMNGTTPDTKADTQIPFSKEKAEYTTNEYGQIKVTDLPEGKYYFVETAAPDNIFMDGASTEILTIDPETNGQTQEIEKTDTDFTTNVELFKADNFDESAKTGIAGVEFTLYKLEDKNDTVETKTTDADGNVSFTIKEAGTYRIQETASAYGYKYDKDKAYTADFVIRNTADFQNNVLHLANTADTAKTDLEGTLDSYELTITNALADKWQQTVTNQRQTGSVTLSKKDNTDPKKITDLDGVTFTLYKAGESQALGEFQTGKAYQKNEKAETGWEELDTAAKAGTLTISGLPWGDYYMVETKADSYVLSDTKYEFTIGNVQDEKAHSGLFVDLGTIYNEKIRGDLLLKKKDGQGNPLENAVFTLYKMKGDTANTSADEKIQENLTTDKNGEIRVENLPEGKYYFVETAAPDNVFMDGRSSEVAVIDQSVHSKTIEVDMVNTNFQAGVELVKTDADTGAALSGVEFTLYRKEGEAYTEVSRQGTDANGKAAFMLSQAGSYKVVETIGAYGYDYDAENPYTAEFTVTNTADFQNTVLTLADSVSEAVAKKYDVKISGNLSQNTGSVTNRKTPAEETGSITVTKYLQLDGMTNGLELGAADSTFYTALFTDAEGTRRYSDVKALHIQNGTSTSVTFDDLPKGTYYVFETLEDGTRIPYEELTADANGNLYYCTGVGTENIAISPQQKEASAELYNWYMDLPDGYYMSGRLEITKNVIKNGETAETDDIFYAGVFDESGNLVTVAELLQNGTVTVDVRLGGADYTQPITYTVEETDKDGNALDESFPYDIEVSGSGYISRENPIGSITITNTVIEEEPEPTETPAPTETPTPEPTEIPDNGSYDGSSGGHGSSNVKTGDDTNAQPFVLLFLLSGTVLIYIGRKRRKSA